MPSRPTDDVPVAEATAEVKQAVRKATDIAADSNERIRAVESDVHRPLIKRLATFGLVLLFLYFITTIAWQSHQNTQALNQLRKDNRTIADSNKRLSQTNERLTHETELLYDIVQEQDDLLRRAGIDPVDPFDPGIRGPGTSPNRSDTSPSPGTTQPDSLRGPRSLAGGSAGGSGTTTSPAPSARPSGSPAPAPRPTATPAPTLLPGVPLPSLPLPLPPLPTLLPLAAVQPEGEQMNYINPWLALIALFLPLVVAAVTNGGASATVKGWVLAVLSGLTALIAQVLDTGLGNAKDWREVANNLLLVFVTAVVGYKGGLVRAPATRISNSTADKGIGTPVRPLLRDPQTGRFRRHYAD